jgi:hypothetical protein
MFVRQTRGGPRQVELDHLGRAGAYQEQQLDVGPAGEQAIDDAVELVVAIGHPGKVALLDDRGGEPWLGEHHHAGGRLEQMRAGARTDHEEKGVLDLAVEPDDPGQPAKHFPLPAFAKDGRPLRRVRRRRAARDGEGGRRAHLVIAISEGATAP